MRLEEVARRHVPSITPTSSIEDCARVMRDSGHRLLPVVEAARLRGVISLSDIVFRSIAEGSDWFLAQTRDFMTRDVVSCETTMTCDEALAQFDGAGLLELPLIDRDLSYRGMLYRSDLTILTPLDATGGERLPAAPVAQSPPRLHLVSRKVSH